MKRCRICNETKPLSEFYVRKDSLDGYRGDCKACLKVLVKRSPSAVARRKRAEGNRVLQSRVDYSRTRAEWYQANKERRRRDAHAWNVTNRDKTRAWSSRWQKENPERAAENARRRRAVLKNAETKVITVKDLRRLVLRFRGLCAYCGANPWRHFDHVIPLSRGGRHTIGNLLPACQECNCSKHARTVMAWRARRLSTAA